MNQQQHQHQQQQGSSSSLLLNARSLAQEIASRYFHHYNPYERHRYNVEHCLREPVQAVTIHLLTNAHGEVEALKAADGHTTTTSSHSTHPVEPTSQGLVHKNMQEENGGQTTNWKDPLAPPTTEIIEVDLLEADMTLYEGLHRRSKARMEAFLEGVALAVASSSSSTQKDKTTKTINGSKHDISLADGLKGFGVKDGSTSSGSSNGDQGSLSPPPSSSVARLSGQNLLRSLSAGQVVRKKEKQAQLEEADLTTRLELYIRCLCRVKSLGQECVLAAEPPRALKARANAIVTSFVTTVSTVRQQSPILTRLLTNLTKELLAVEYLSPELNRTIRRIVSDYEQQTSFASLAFLSTPDNSAEHRLTPMILKYIKFLQVEYKNHVADCELERMLTLSLDHEMRKTLKTIEFQSIGHLLETCADFRPQLQKIEFPPTTSIREGQKLVDDPDAVRQAIRDLQRERITVNGHLLPPVTSRKELIHLLQQTMNSRTLTSMPMKPRRKSRSRGARNRQHRSTSDHSSEGEFTGTSESDFTSAAESDADKNKTSREQQPHQRNFHVSTIDVLTKRLLLAASRTGTGGDAYFVVRDLFGGEDVEVIPSDTLPTHGRAVRPGTIEILVRLASVTIKCHGSFDVYPKSMVRTCEPLIQLHTTTTETISLQEVRACDSMEDDDHPDDYETDQSGKVPKKAVMVLQEREVDKSGWRTLSIRPALYEKVEVWNTPS